MASDITNSLEIKSKSELLKVWSSFLSVRVSLICLIPLIFWRFTVPFGFIDLFVIVFVGLLIGPFEWVVHKYALHASENSALNTKFATQESHEEHHDEPRKVDLIPFGLKTTLFILAGILLIAVLLSAALSTFGFSRILSTFLILGYMAVAHYELVHLFAHSRVSTKNSYYKKKRQRHMQHHVAPEINLGVSSNLGDVIFRTIK